MRNSIWCPRSNSISNAHAWRWGSNALRASASVASATLGRALRRLSSMVRSNSPTTRFCFVGKIWKPGVSHRISEVSVSMLGGTRTRIRVSRYTAAGVLRERTCSVCESNRPAPTESTSRRTIAHGDMPAFAAASTNSVTQKYSLARLSSRDCDYPAHDGSNPVPRSPRHALPQPGAWLVE